MTDRAWKQSQRLEAGRNALFQLSQRQVIVGEAPKRFVIARIGPNPLFEDEIRSLEFSSNVDEILRGDSVPLAFARPISERVCSLKALSGGARLRQIRVGASQVDVGHRELWVELDSSFVKDQRCRVTSLQERLLAEAVGSQCFERRCGDLL